MVFRTAVEDERGRSDGAIEDEEAIDAVVCFARMSGLRSRTACCGISAGAAA